MDGCEHFRISIPSDTAAGVAIQEQIVEKLKQLEYSDRDVFSVRLALEEALVNAIKHGNRMDPQKKVHICCRIAPDCVTIEIEDEGDGFCPDEVPDPTAEENLDKPSGRGIMLMKAFMTELRYSPQGNRVFMSKRRECPGEDNHRPEPDNHQRTS